MSLLSHQEHSTFNFNQDYLVWKARKEQGLPNYRNINLPNHHLVGQTFASRIVESVNIQFHAGEYYLVVLSRVLGSESHRARSLTPFRYRFISKEALILEGMSRGSIQELLKAEEEGESDL